MKVESDAEIIEIQPRSNRTWRADYRWPVFDDPLSDRTIHIVPNVNGRMRDKIVVSPRMPRLRPRVLRWRECGIPRSVHRTNNPSYVFREIDAIRPKPSNDLAR